MHFIIAACATVPAYCDGAMHSAVRANYTGGQSELLPDVQTPITPPDIYIGNSCRWV